MSTISLSITEIERLIHALSALRSHYNREKPVQVPLITADRREALTPLIKSAIGETALKIGGEADLSGDEDIVTINIDRDAAGVRAAVEQGCALRVLQLANTGYDSRAAADYGEQADSAIESVRAAMAGSGATGKIVPNWY